ncbi:hypothetical protein DFH07DRAFT_918494 [Mycena maculata]|uniref:TPR-like protein n=1 Tax=Mycena maculata TaxID=230809 RepID=A0AAD7JBB9_9AGAR|nr:hypothetical protein DFH07DRAFT_918494 [Mycena maculata]
MYSAATGDVVAMPTRTIGSGRFRTWIPSSQSQSDWLATSITLAKAVSAGAQCLPFPYVQAVFVTVVDILQTVEKVKKNRADVKELCGNILDILNCIQDQLGSRGAAVKFEILCEEFASALEGVLESVKELQARPRGLSGRFKEVIKLSSAADKISGHRTRIQELRLNFLLMAAIDTNLQVHLLASNLGPAHCSQTTNNCPSPSRIFHGRQDILHKMHHYFTKNIQKQHIFLLHGLGGSGKTQIALKFIQQSAYRFTDIFLIDTSTVQTIETSLTNIATAKRVGDCANDALQWLKSKPAEWFLFFDNSDDPKLNLNKYFPQCSHGNILITSRNPGLAVYAGSQCKVSEMDETDAMHLLLRSASQENTDHNRETATQIVKVLHYLPLAIVQAGGFISKSGNMYSYLHLYAHNRARLLKEHPTQLHDNYAWPVYTTWQISFDRLTEKAKTFLKLCSFFHHQGISEDIFRNATNYRLGPCSPSKEELEKTLDILSHFLGSCGSWDPLCLVDITNELRAYSLINLDAGKIVFSIHPLVHDWARTLADEAYHQSAISIAGMSLTGLSDNDVELIGRWMLPHIEFVMGDNSSVVPDFRQEYAAVYLGAGKPKIAEDLQLLVLHDRKSLLGDKHPETLQIMHWLARTYIELGKFKAAEELWVMVLTEREQALGSDHLDTLQAMVDLGMVYIKLGKLKQAEPLLSISLEKRRNILGSDHLNDPYTLRAMTGLAGVYFTLGQLERAEELETVVFHRHVETLGDDHPTTLAAMGALACTHNKLGRLQQAETLRLIVLEKSRIILGSEHPQTLTAMGNLAFTYNKLGKLQEAHELQRVVLKNRQNIQGATHPSTLRAMLNLASTLNSLTKYQEAEELVIVVLDQRRNILGNNHPATLQTMSTMGSTLNNLKRWQEAEELLVEAFNKQKDLYSSGKHPYFVETIQNLQVTYKNLGKLKEAEDLDIVLKSQA